MVELLNKWTGSVEINGIVYGTVTQIPENLEFNEGWCIKLLPKNYKQDLSGNSGVQDSNNTKQEYFITVKKYMTQPATPEFDFMEKFNHNVPMPMRMMAGTIEKETRGMYYMKLHGTMYAEKMTTCMCCGRPLTNPVSQYFGVGPECGNHGYVNPFDSDEELKAAVAQYKKTLQDITWEGWCIKSAILSIEEV